MDVVEMSVKGWYAFGGKNKNKLWVGLLLALMLFFTANMEAQAWDWGDDSTTSDSDTLSYDEEWDCSDYPGTVPDAYGNCVEETLASDEEWDCSEYGAGYVADEYGNCVTELEYASDGVCKEDADCGAGFECYQDTCVDNDTYAENTTWYESAWESTTDFFSGDAGTPSSAGTDLFEVTKAIDIPGIGTVPAGTTISSTGVVTSSDGRELGYVSNGTLDSITQSAGVSQVSSDGYNGSGDPYNDPNFVGPPTTTQIKCGVGFRSVGGVCFPTNTGLSEAPVDNIITNLFVWLMGIFVTLAIIAFIISGIMYLTAYGDNAQMESAKKNAKWAVMGIIVGLSGFIVVNAISKALSGASIF